MLKLTIPDGGPLATYADDAEEECHDQHSPHATGGEPKVSCAHVLVRCQELVRARAQVDENDGEPERSPRNSRWACNVWARMIGLSRFAHLLVVAAALIACAPVPTPSQTPTVSPSAPPSSSASPSASITATVVDTADGFSFQRPSGWTRWQPNEHNPINDGPLIYLSTDPLLPACAVVPEASPNPPNGQGRACDRPLTTLAPNGVLVTWLTTRILVPLPSAGERIEMNGDEARIKIERPGGCASIGGDESIYVLVPIGQPTPLSNLAVSACLRGPDLATAEVQVRVMLVSATIGQ